MISTLNKVINRLSINNLLGKTSNWRHLSSIKSSDVDPDFFQTERHFEDITVDKFKDLITDKTTEDEISKILSEYEYEKYTTLRVPSTLTTNQMKDLMTVKDTTERKRWFDYLFQRENARNKTNERRKKHSEEYWTQKRQLYATKNAERTGIWDNDHQLLYGLWHNTLFSKILKNSVNRYYNHRLRTAALFGQKLVVDLSYDQYMKLSECRQLATQMHLLYNWNRYQSEEPFDLHFTNCDHNTPTLQAMKKNLTNHDSPNFMAEFHEKSHIDLFPKEQLVYLSPHSELTLRKYNPDHIYIIGGIIDKSYHQPITYIRAKEAGIRCMRLPIDDHIVWNAGSKSLCLNHVCQILHDIKQTGDFGKALKQRIPQRKQKSIEQIEYEDMLRKQKLNRLKNMSKFNPKIANNFF